MVLKKWEDTFYRPPLRNDTKTLSSLGGFFGLDLTGGGNETSENGVSKDRGDIVLDVSEVNAGSTGRISLALS